MTGRLVGHYRSPTPLHTGLRFEGRLESVSGRKILTRGELYAGYRLCAEAEALFISIDGARFAQMMEQRASQQAEAAAPPEAPRGRGARSGEPEGGACWCLVLQVLAAARDDPPLDGSRGERGP